MAGGYRYPPEFVETLPAVALARRPTSGLVDDAEGINVRAAT
jgi:hypothetical protein